MSRRSAYPWSALPLALAVWLILLPAAGRAEALTGEALEQRVREISDQLRCPTCQAISVKDSEASFSRQIRDKVRAMLQEGKSEEEIKAYFVARYGEWILRAPKKEGVGLVLWWLPGLAIVAVGGWLGLRLYRSTRGEPSAAVPAEPLAEEELRRIERDLRRYEEG